MQQPFTNAHFRGQQPGETMMLHVHEYWLILVWRAWPAFIAVVAWIVLLTLQGLGFLTIAVGFIMLGLLTRWAIADLLAWYYRWYIITDRRVITTSGIVTQRMEAIELRNVQAVNVATGSFDELLFGYGRVSVAAAGGTGLTMRGIASPQAVATLINQLGTAHKAPNTQPQPVIADPAIQQILDTLGAPESPPDPALLDAANTRRWPLSHAFDVAIDPDEALLGVVSRHWWALARPLIVPVALFIAAFFVLLNGGWLNFFVALICLLVMIIGVIWSAVIYLNFADDVYVFTTRRIIDVQRRFFIFYATNVSIGYDKIQEIQTAVPSLWARVLHYGTLTISAAGTSGMTIDRIPAPAKLARAVERNRLALARRTEIATTNREKQKMKDWFGAVIGEMVVIVPELRGLPLEQALEEAQRAGLRPMTMGASSQLANVPPNIVVAQSPLPGSRAFRGGDVALLLNRAP